MEKEFTDACTGFTGIILLNERSSDGYTWSGERRGNKLPLRPDDTWPDMWKFMSDAAKKKAQQKLAIVKPNLDNARQLRGIYFFEPNDEDSSS